MKLIEDIEKFRSAKFRSSQEITLKKNKHSVVRIRVWSTMYFLTQCLLIITTWFFTLQRSAAQETVKKFAPSNQVLGLVGYNYTNRDIESYTIDNVSGGDIKLSSSTSGGGGVACCFDYYLGAVEKIRVKVRWQVDGCTYVLRNPLTNATAAVRHLYYKEKLVQLEKRFTSTPEFIETHIFPNGSVKVFLTSELTSPLLRLDGERPDKSLFPRCKNDKKPQE